MPTDTTLILYSVVTVSHKIIMGCMFSVSSQKKIVCVLCEGVNFDYYYNFSEHLFKKHSVEKNLKFVLAACHLNIEVLETVVSKFDESLEDIQQELESVNLANLNQRFPSSLNWRN